MILPRIGAANTVSVLFIIISNGINCLESLEIEYTFVKPKFSLTYPLRPRLIFTPKFRSFHYQLQILGHFTIKFFLVSTSPLPLHLSLSRYRQNCQHKLSSFYTHKENDGTLPWINQHGPNAF